MSMERAIALLGIRAISLFSDRRRKRVNGDGIRAIALSLSKGDRSLTKNGIKERRSCFAKSPPSPNVCPNLLGNVTLWILSLECPVAIVTRASSIANPSTLARMLIFTNLIEMMRLSFPIRVIDGLI
jgi:hypothetical protein